MLPLPQSDLLVVLVALRESDDPEIAGAAAETLQAERPEDLLIAAKAEDTAPTVLSYLATLTGGPRNIHEATILNSKTPDPALATFASATEDASLLELIAINQQRLVRSPDIIEAILGNPARALPASRSRLAAVGVAVAVAVSVAPCRRRLGMAMGHAPGASFEPPVGPS